MRLADPELQNPVANRLAQLGGRLAVEALELAACGGLSPAKQPAEGVTYAHKVDKAEARVDWTQPAALIERRLRAFDPFPGMVTAFGGEPVKVWRGQVLPGGAAAAPGTVVATGSAGIDVATGDGVLRLTQLQRAGGRRLAAADFLRGLPLAVGSRFGAPAP